MVQGVEKNLVFIDFTNILIILEIFRMGSAKFHSFQTPSIPLYINIHYTLYIVDTVLNMYLPIMARDYIIYALIEC